MTAQDVALQDPIEYEYEVSKKVIAIDKRRCPSIGGIQAQTEKRPKLLQSLGEEIGTRALMQQDLEERQWLGMRWYRASNV